ncbi:MAG: TIGR00282 family metallophosphoesterase [Spirochaetaceae bacterium]|nr:TIGR00282 family metallophosphoesterase [Spirochaetaceae bacterium]
MGIRILYVGEIVGKTGVFTVKKLLSKIKKERRVDFVIGNADSATGGAGLGRQHAIYLRKLGMDAITLGECAYYKRDIVEHMQGAPYLLRPANYPYGNPGRGYRVYPCAAGKVGVVQLLGQAGFPRVHLANPLVAVTELARKLHEETPVVILEFHAATTAEKLTMSRYADGLVSAIIGSHTKALTADARILPGGTAYITDAGRTGSLASVGGLDPAIRIGEYLTGIPVWAKDGTAGLELQGCLLEIGDDGRATSVEALRIACEEVLDDGTGDSDRSIGKSGDRPA